MKIDLHLQFYESYYSTIFQDDHTAETIYNEGTKYITTKYEVYVFIVFIYQYAAPLLYLTFAYSRMSYTLSKVAWNYSSYI